MHQQKLLNHWLKYMPVHPEYIAYAIRYHFHAAPWDAEVLRPILADEWKRIKGLT